MDFLLPDGIIEDRNRLKAFLAQRVAPNLSTWFEERAFPRDLFREMGEQGWLGFNVSEGKLVEQSALKQAVLFEELAKISPGIAVAILVQISLGGKGLVLFGSDKQKEAYLNPSIRGETLLCVGNTEPMAGSDVANIAADAKQVDGGWLLNGTKAYVTNGAIADFGLITAITDPDAGRNHRISMLLVDLSSKGVTRKKLNKDVWIPSDLTRLTFKDVFVPEENLVGNHGKGLQQVLEIFTNSRLTISALTLGTAAGAFELGLNRAKRREAFGKKLADFQAKSFEIADFFTKIEAARLMVMKACWTRDQGKDFRLEASMAKYLTVEVAREVGLWAADLFGAASVVVDHPIHKFPLDAWASSLGEGTQDVQKLIISREVLKRDSF